MIFPKQIVKLDDFITQPSLISRLKRLLDIFSEKDIFLNLLFNGCRHSGKKTLVNCILYELFGEKTRHLEKVEYEQKVGNNNIEICFYKSMYHYIIDPSKYMNYDKIVLIEFIKNFLSTKNIANNYFNISADKSRLP